MGREKSDADGIIIINTKTPFIINVVRVVCLNNAAVLEKKTQQSSFGTGHELRTLKDYNNWKIIPMRPEVYWAMWWIERLPLLNLIFAVQCNNNCNHHIITTTVFDLHKNEMDRTLQMRSDGENRGQGKTTRRKHLIKYPSTIWHDTLACTA